MEKRGYGSRAGLPMHSAQRTVQTPELALALAKSSYATRVWSTGGSSSTALFFLLSSCKEMGLEAVRAAAPGTRHTTNL